MTQLRQTAILCEEVRVDVRDGAREDACGGDKLLLAPAKLAAEMVILTEAATESAGLLHGEFRLIAIRARDTAPPRRATVLLCI